MWHPLKAVRHRSFPARLTDYHRAANGIDPVATVVG